MNNNTYKVNEQVNPIVRKLKFIIIEDKECDGKNCGTYIRTSGPKCICSHNNLLVTHPELCKQWDYEKNENPPSYYSRGSNVKVYWICPIDPCGCHKFCSSINDRTGKSTKGCKFCNSGTPCPHNNLTITHPELSKEWDYERNEKGPENYTYGSGIKVHWICPLNPCGCHNYEAQISSRTSMESGCKFCNSGTPCPHNNLTITHLELSKEWDYERNEKGPENYTQGSIFKVHWICPLNPCGCHNYSSSILNRSFNSSGCKYCNKNHPCPHNNLLITHPTLCNEWDYENNNQRPESYTFGSAKKAFWLCDNNHCYELPICYRTHNLLGCTTCTTPKYSKISIKWINGISKKENINIQCATNDGEYKIEGIGKVDGYCRETNTVYEFHGDFWHGNPLIFDPEKVNPMSNKKYGDLYIKTIKRDELIISKGYNLVTIWENDYRKNEKNKFCVNMIVK